MSTYSTPQLRTDRLILSATQILDAAFFEASVTTDMNCACTCGETACAGGGTATQSA